MKIDWKSKLTSRKFWAAIIGVITTIMVALKISDLSIQQVVAVVTSVSVLIAYILGEGMVDAARLKAQGENPITQNIYSAIPPEEAALKCHDFNVSTIYTTKPLNSTKAYENAKVAMESISPEDDK